MLWHFARKAWHGGGVVHFSKKKKLRSHRGVAVLNLAALQCLHFHVLVGEFVGVLL